MNENTCTRARASHRVPSRARCTSTQPSPLSSPTRYTLSPSSQLTCHGAAASQAWFTRTAPVSRPGSDIVAKLAQMAAANGLQPLTGTEIPGNFLSSCVWPLVFRIPHDTRTTHPQPALAPPSPRAAAPRPKAAGAPRAPRGPALSLSRRESAELSDGSGVPSR